MCSFALRQMSAGANRTYRIAEIRGQHPCRPEMRDRQQRFGFVGGAMRSRRRQNFKCSMSASGRKTGGVLLYGNVGFPPTS